MSILDTLKDVIKRALKGPNFHPRNPSYWATKFWGGIESKTGIRVDEESAMKYSAYFSGIKLIAESIASLPLNVYRDLPAGGKQKETKNPLHYLLHDQPNPDMTSFIWRETKTAHILGWGNHYSIIKRNPLKRYAEEIYPLEPWRVKPEMVNTSIGRVKVYRYMPEEGPEVVLSSDDVLHIPGLSFNGLVGKSPLGWHREQIGLGLAMEEYSERFFSNGMNAGGIFSTPQVLKPETYDRLVERLKKNYAGLGKSHGTMVLEQELKFDKLSVNPNDAQLLESKKFQVSEIARILNIPLPFLQIGEPVSDNNIEHLGIFLVVFCLRPWLVRDEQSYNVQLFPESEKGIYYTKHIVDGLLRGDIKTRWEAYTKGFNTGSYSPNDILEMEDKNPYKGGEKHFIQLNMQSVEDMGSQGNDTQGASSQKAIESRDLSPKLAEKLGKAYKPLFVNALIRVLKREKVDLLKISNTFIENKDAKLLGNNILDFYKKHDEFVNSQIKPIVYAFIEALGAEKDIKQSDITIFADNYSEDFTERYMDGMGSLIKTIGNDDYELDFNKLTEHKPEELSTIEMPRITKAFSKYIEKIGA